MSAFLNRWDPNQLIKYKPFITAACGFRRSGKSFLQAHILNKLCHEFQLVCSFTGSLNCSPEMQKIFEHKLDPRFQFQKLNIRFLKTLMIQQETLARNGMCYFYLMMCFVPEQSRIISRSLLLGHDILIVL